MPRNLRRAPTKDHAYFDDRIAARPLGLIEKLFAAILGGIANAVKAFGFVHIPREALFALLGDGAGQLAKVLSELAKRQPDELEKFHHEVFFRR
jgi:hypothetical protein